MKNNKPVLTVQLRQTMKDMFAKELEQLPALIAELLAKERLDYLLKLMPFVLPKVNNVSQQSGEPDEFKMQEYHF